MPKVKKNPAAPTTQTPQTHHGGVTSTGTATPIGGPVTAATTANTELKGLGYFTVDDQGCRIQFGIEPQQYLLAASTPNYNAMFSTLLACKFDGQAVRITYALPLITVNGAAQDAPLRIVSLLTI